MDNNAYFKYQEHRGQSGYKAAILVKEAGASKYSLLVASETVPSIFGTQDSFEFDLLNSPVKGKIAGKMTLDDKEVEVLHHRDNVYRFHKLKDKVLDFMYVDSQFVGYKFNGTLAYRVNDASADVLRGTYTITPMSADPNPYFNVREEVQETLCFGESVPETIKVGDTINLSVVQKGASVSYETFTIANDGKEGEKTTLSVADGKATIATAGLIGITAKAEGYASWTTTVYVEATA